MQLAVALIHKILQSLGYTSTKPTKKYMETMHFVMTEWSLLHFLESADPQVS